MKTWIKICGTTNLADALAAVDAGADALGFLFADSRRRVELETVKAIVAELPANTEKIGVFVNEPAEVVMKVARDAGLTGVQLHGDESPKYVNELRQISGDNRIKVLKSISAEAAQSQGLGSFSGCEECVDVLMVDSGNVIMRGGTGRVFDWLRSSDFVMSLQQRSPVVIAGGLDPQNVGAAICLFRPWGVDVVTGVEKKFGKKDHAKVRSFIAAVRAADQLPSGAPVEDKHL
ncbi:MAG: phosphoribosylanthranilate isomerase [Acidobacteriaceae bacterium]|nr:phosphoribosylanthranilate isomerase [Acidobacteriaceae bacterium]